MTTGIDVDRRLTAWMADEAPGRAPDRLLEDALEVVGLTTQRPGRSARPLGDPMAAWRALTPTRRLLLAAALTLGAFAAAAAGALLLRSPDDPSPGLVLVRALDGADRSSGVVVLEQRGGSTRELARFDATALGGTWNGVASLGPSGRLALGIGVGSGRRLAIVDLRGVEEPRHLDAVGSGASWAPDGVRIATTDDEGALVVDLVTGASTRLSGEASIVGFDRDVVWAADGGGLLADPGIESIGVLRLDGTFVDGHVPRHDSGMGPRRIRADGTYLRCAATHDQQCVADDLTLMALGDEIADVWRHDDPSISIADFAWAANGGIWVLTEPRRASGAPSPAVPWPRTLTLLRVEDDGTESVTATFSVGAEDQGSPYCPAGEFAAMAPDDSRIAIWFPQGLCPGGGSYGRDVAYLLDVDARTTVEVDGIAAGWLSPDDLTRPRQPLPTRTPGRTP